MKQSNSALLKQFGMMHAESCTGRMSSAGGETRKTLLLSLSFFLQFSSVQEDPLDLKLEIIKHQQSFNMNENKIVHSAIVISDPKKLYSQITGLHQSVSMVSVILFCGYQGYTLKRKGM